MPGHFASEGIEATRFRNDALEEISTGCNPLEALNATPDFERFRLIVEKATAPPRRHCAGSELLWDIYESLTRAAS